MNNFITTLYTIINSSNMKDNNYRIAYCLLKRNKEIEKMSIKELASECQVAQVTFNKFINFYGYPNYSIFRNTYLQHIKIRELQMLERYNDYINHEHTKQIDTIFNNKNDIKIYNKKISDYIEKIHHSQRIVFVGSDEMIYHGLRFQGDFCTMGKLVLKSSLYKNAFIIPQKDDFVILCSMTGRIIELNNHLFSNLMQNDPYIMTIGHYNYLHNEDMSLIIPKNKSEIDELSIFEYYLESILYSYMERYYVNR